MYLILLSVKQGGIKYHFKVIGMTRPGIEPRSPGPLANTLLTRSITSTHTHTHTHIYIYIYIYHHVVPLVRISLTLSCHFSLSFIASGRSSGLHPVSSQSFCIYIRAGRPALARPYEGNHRSTSLMSSSLLLQQYPACLVRLTWIVFVMGGRWPYNRSFLGCCRQDLFNIARNILV